MKHVAIFVIGIIVGAACVAWFGARGDDRSVQDGALGMQQSEQEGADGVMRDTEPRPADPAPTRLYSGEMVEVYDGIEVPTNVTTLDLSGRGLTGSLRAEVNQLTNIETLDLTGNAFTGVPAEVGQLTTLRTLNLSDNPITGLPYEIGNLSNLEVLDLRGTNYAQVDLNSIVEQLPASTRILTD